MTTDLETLPAAMKDAVNAKDDPTAYESAQNYVRKIPGESEGNRSNTLNGVAYRVLEHFEINETEHRELMLEFNNRFLPPLSEAEAIKTIQSAWKGCHRKNAIGSKKSSTRIKSKTVLRPNTAIFTNYYFQEGKNKKSQIRAKPLRKIFKEFEGLLNHWPKRVEGELFTVFSQDILFLNRPEDLFAWIASNIQVGWKSGIDKKGKSFVTRLEFFSYLKMKVEKFKAIERLPHHPLLEDHFYYWSPSEKYMANGKRLKRLLTYFDNCETKEDLTLLLAMIVTPAWGGLCGTRPCFVILADDRGSGKSTLADIVCLLYGGPIDFDPKNGEEKFLSRLLSTNTLSKRVIRIDNVKGRFSSSFIENLVTAIEINGHRLYKSDASRPNTLTCLLTGNNLHLSRDIAERSFIIRLKKPKDKPQWREKVLKFVTQYRDEILADIIALLQSPPAACNAPDRWGDFCRNVLARCTDDPDSIIKMNQKRRGDSDEDLDQAERIFTSINAYLSQRKEENFIPAQVVTKIINECLNVNWTAPKIGQILKEHIQAGRLQGLKEHRTSKCRGYRMTQ